MAFQKLATHQVPGFIGGWCLVGIVAASLSTASGAILAMGTVFTHNMVRQLDHKFPNLVTPDNLLTMARVMTIPFTITSACLAAYYRETGYLLIVAFDIVLATVVAPLFGCFYVKNPSPRAAFLSTLTGATTRIVLEFALPKDGSLLLPYNMDEFYNYGSAASAGVPVFVDPGVAGTSQWDPVAQVCEQEQFKDYTGVDSLSAFLVSIAVFVLVQGIENYRGGKPLFTLPGMNPYEKDEKNDDATMVDKSSKTVPVQDEKDTNGDAKDASYSSDEVES
jgi:Na+/proline symporter